MKFEIDSKNKKYGLRTMVGQLEKDISCDPVALEDLFDEFQEIIQNSTAEKTKQIEQNQEIVDVVKQWAQSEPISNGIKLTHEQLKIRRGPVYRLINLIRDKTGIDIVESS